MTPAERAAARSGGRPAAARPAASPSGGRPEAAPPAAALYGRRPEAAGVAARRAAARSCRHPAAADGQASVEFVALLPVVVVVALAVLQVLAAGATREQAGHAVEAAAVALQRGVDPEAAAEQALPDVPARRVAVTVTGRRVSVRISPRVLVPVLADLLATSSTAHAGPAPPSGVPAWLFVRGGDGNSARPGGGR